MKRWDLGLTYVPYFNFGEPRVVDRKLVKECLKLENKYRYDNGLQNTQVYGKVRPVCVLAKGPNPYDPEDKKNYLYVAECRTKPSPPNMDPVRMRVDRWKIANLMHESHLVADPAQVVLIAEDLVQTIRHTGTLSEHDQKKFVAAGRAIEERRDSYRRKYEDVSQFTDSINELSDNGPLLV